MAGINDQSLSTFLDGIDDTLGLSSDISLPINLTDITNTNCSDLDNEFLEEFLQPFKNDEVSPISCSPSSSSSESCQQESLRCSVSSGTSRGIPTMISLSNQSTHEHLRIVEQPYQNSKLRYRADYVREKGRLGVLGNKNETSRMKGPAIHISPCYLNPADQYFIRVSLVTVKYSKSNLHYFHIYELEHPKDQSLNDRANNSVWFPIDSMDSVKSFPFLRIVKKKMVSIQKLDHLRVFDCYHHTTSTQLPLSKETDPVKEYNLDRSQLVFTLGKKQMQNGQSTMIVYANTTVFSEEMTEFDGRPIHADIETDLPNKRLKVSIDDQAVFDYAPRSGLVNTNEQMLISLNKKIDFRKHGDLQITFECDTPQGRWIQAVDDFKIKDSLISCKIPIFPHPIRHATSVDIILRQKNYLIGVLKYSYLPNR